MSSRTSGWLRMGAMGLVSLVVAHNLIFLAGFGASSGDVLARTGHSTAWSSAVVTVLVGAFGGMLFALRQLRRLAIQASAASTVGSRGPSIRPLAERWARLGLRLTVLTTVAFVLQENVEHFSAGEVLPGLSTLGSAEYPNAIWIIILVAISVGFVGALFGWRLEHLSTRIRSARRLRRISPPPRRIRIDVDRRPLTLLGPGFAGRAPPDAAICQPSELDHRSRSSSPPADHPRWHARIRREKPCDRSAAGSSRAWQPFSSSRC